MGAHISFVHADSYDFKGTICIIVFNYSVLVVNNADIFQDKNRSFLFTDIRINKRKDSLILKQEDLRNGIKKMQNFRVTFQIYTR